MDNDNNNNNNNRTNYFTPCAYRRGNYVPVGGSVVGAGVVGDVVVGGDGVAVREKYKERERVMMQAGSFQSCQARKKARNLTES